MAGGAAGSQAIWLIFVPILTRIYDPVAFGVHGVFASIVTIAGPLASMAYPIAIVLPEKEDESIAISIVSIISALALSLLSIIILFFSCGFLERYFDLSDMGGLIFLLPPAIFFANLQQVSYNWNIREQRFKFIAKVAIAQSLFINLARCGLGLVYPTAASLVGVAAVGPLVHARMLSAGWRDVFRSLSAQKWSVSDLWRAARRHADFPKYRAPQMIVSAVSESLPVLVLASVIGSASAGLYALATLALQAPVSLIGKSVDNVFYPQFRSQSQQGLPLRPAFLRVIAGLAIVGLPPFAFVFFFGPQVFALVFGAEWARAGDYASWLALWLYFMLVNRPCIGATSVLGMQKIFLVHTVCTLAARAAALVIGVRYFSNDLLTVALFSVVGGISCISLIVLVFWRLRNER